MSHAGLCAARDRFLNRLQAIVCDKPIHTAGPDEAILDDVGVKFTTSDQLKERKRSTVERVIARAWHRRGKRRNLRVERGGTIRAAKG
jgi:hypothetical protein